MIILKLNYYHYYLINLFLLLVLLIVSLYYINLYIIISHNYLFCPYITTKKINFNGVIFGVGFNPH